MAWKWYEIKNYKASVGGGENHYGGVQPFGDGFFALLKFNKAGLCPLRLHLQPMASVFMATWTISKCRWLLISCVTKGHSILAGMMAP